MKKLTLLPLLAALLLAGCSKGPILSLDVLGPPSQTYRPGQKDAVLADIQMTAQGQDILLNQFYVLIEGVTNIGTKLSVQNLSDTDEVHEVLENVKLRNSLTGELMSGSFVQTNWAGQASSASFDIYKFSPSRVLPEKSTEDWVLTADFRDNDLGKSPKSGDRFRAHICSEPMMMLSGSTIAANTTGCTLGVFGGRITGFEVAATFDDDKPVVNVRPGGTISANFHEIAASKLTVNVKPMQAADTVVKNQKNVPFVRFEASAQNFDVLLHRTTFRAVQGDASSAFNYSLWADTNNDQTVDTVLQSGVQSQNNQVQFAALANGGYIIPKNTSVLFEVHGDVVSSYAAANPVIALGFTNDDAALGAEEIQDGTALNGPAIILPNGQVFAIYGCPTISACDIELHDATATVFSFKNQGDLYVTNSTNPIRHRQLLGGALEPEIQRLTLRAEHEDIDIMTLPISLKTIQFGETPTAQAVTILGNQIRQLELYKPGQTTPFAIATRAACGVMNALTPPAYCAAMQNQQLIVGDGESVDILIRPRMNTDTEGATSGIVFWTTLDKGLGLKARGLESSNTIAENNGDSVANGEVFVGTSSPARSVKTDGPLQYTTLAKVTSIVNAEAMPDGSPVPVGNDRTIGRFRFTTAPNSNTKNGNNDWVLRRIVFTVASSKVAFGTGNQSSASTSDFFVYNTADPAAKSACTATLAALNGTFQVTCAGLGQAGGMNSAISAGQNATFALETDILAAQTGASLRVSLHTFGPDFSNGANMNNNHIHWLDKDSGSEIPWMWIDYPVTRIDSTCFGCGGQSSSTSSLTSSVGSLQTSSISSSQQAAQALTITQRPQALYDTAVKNQKNTPLLRFEARANKGDVTVHGFTFTKAAGDTNVGSLNNAVYSLWADMNGDGNVETLLKGNAQNTSGLIRFDDFSGGSRLIPSGQTLIMEVRGDIGSSLASDTLVLSFATGMTFVDAEQNGQTLRGIMYSAANEAYKFKDCETAFQCATEVKLSSATIYNLKNQGNLFIKKSGVPTRNRQLLGGSLESDILRLTAHAEYEDIDVRNIAFSFTNADALAAIQQLELYTSDSSSPFASASRALCGGKVYQSPYTMCANIPARQFVVPKGTDREIIVRPRMNADQDGTVAGKVIEVYFGQADGADIAANGITSQNALFVNDGDSEANGEILVGRDSAGPSMPILGTSHISTLSKLATITNASPDEDGTAIPTGNAHAIGQFKFTALPNRNTKNGINAWSAYGLIFNVRASNVLLGEGNQTSPQESDFYLYNQSDPSVKALCVSSAAQATGQFFVTCTDLIDLPINTDLSPGESMTLVLQADIVNPKVSSTATSELQVSLTKFSRTSLTGPFPTEFDSLHSHILWVDKDALDATAFYWTDQPETTVNSTKYIR